MLGQVESILQLKTKLRQGEEGDEVSLLNKHLAGFLDDKSTLDAILRVVKRG